MTKKILIGALVAVLVGALAVAAVDLIGGSANAEGGQQHGVSGRSGDRPGQAADGSGAAANQSGSKGYGRQGQESAQESTADATASEAGQGQGNGRGAAGQQGQESGQANRESEASVEAWLTYEGTVVASDDQTVTIATDDGQELVIKLGPSWYWQDQDLSVQVGDEVSVTGFYDGEDFEAGQITNQTAGQTLLLRDEDGRPMWSGRGRRGQG